MAVDQWDMSTPPLFKVRVGGTFYQISGKDDPCQLLEILFFDIIHFPSKMKVFQTELHLRMIDNVKLF